MTNAENPHATNEDLEGFDTLDSEFDSEGNTAAQTGDAGYQDVADDLDAEVFGEAQPTEETPKKKGINWFNIGVFAVALAIAGGLIWFKMSPQAAAPAEEQAGQAAPAASQKQPTGAASSAAEAAQQAVHAPTQDAAATSAGVLDNPDQLATFNQTNPAPTQDVPSQDPFAALGNATPAAPQAPASPQPQAAAPVVPVPTPISGVADAQPVPAPAVAQTPVSQVSGDLTARVDALEQKLNDMDGKLTTALDKIGTGSAAAPADDARLSAIQDTLDKLSARMDGLSSTGDKGVVAAAPVASTEETPAEVQKPVARKVPKPVRRKMTAAKATSEWDQPYKTTQDGEKSLSAPVSGKGSNGWELRGAQDGRAVLAKDGDLREVGVGGSVPGLGQITGIAATGGRRGVAGAAGRVAQ